MKKQYKHDVILGSVFLAIALVCGLFFYMQTRKEANQVKIWQKDKVIKVLDLNQDQRYLVSGEDGFFNEVIIEQGQVWIGKTNCPNKDCVHQGKISSVGTQLVCLPHQVIVEIDNVKEEGVLDGISK